LRAGLAADPPDLVIPIDYPGFNLRLARAAKERGVRVLYYIAPQVWAWHRSRARKLAEYTDRMAVILPFEEAVFRSAGGHATFVGHPLLDAEPRRRPRVELCDALGLDAGRPILALFPGSRRQELDRHLQLFTQAAERVRESRPDVQPVIAAGATLDDALFAGARLPRTRDAWELLHHATAALVKSGTSTLQAALTITPMVVAYRMHPATFAVARRVVRVPHVGLANLVAGDRVVPELLQDEATPAALAAALLPLLEDGSEARQRAETGLARVRGALAAGVASGSVADRVAALAAELIAPDGAPRA
jgi:lipid-A-disaccharide synthase